MKFSFAILCLITVGVCDVKANKGSSLKSASDLAIEMYRDCLKDFSITCVQPRALNWFNEAINQNEIQITDKLSIVRTANDNPQPRESTNDADDDNIMFLNKIENFLAAHALHLKAPEFFQTPEARSIIPSFLLDNSLTKGAVVPLAESRAIEGRGFMRKVLIPFLVGLKLKTTILVPLALALIALKTWKAMTLGLLSLVLSGALVIFKIAKPKIINYEVVHYPPPHHHVEHIELPHHIEHAVPHHIDPHHFAPHHIEQHLPHHIDLPHHVDHVEHLEHPQPSSWDPHAWARSSQEAQDAQEMAYAGQR